MLSKIETLVKYNTFFFCLDKMISSFKQVKYKTMITELSGRSTGTLRLLSYESLKAIWV